MLHFCVYVCSLIYLTITIIEWLYSEVKFTDSKHLFAFDKFHYSYNQLKSLNTDNNNQQSALTRTKVKVCRYNYSMSKNQCSPIYYH